MSDSGRRRNRYRGAIYVALALRDDGDSVYAVHVAVDLLGACRPLASAEHGEIWVFDGPDHGGKFRHYVEGGPDPVETVSVSRWPENYVTMIARESDANLRTARRNIVAYLRKAGGIGADLYDAARVVKS